VPVPAAVDRSLRRVLAASTVLVAVVALGSASAAGAADFTWTGAAAAPNWSDPANWAGDSAPGGSVGQLAFPALGSPGCQSSPAASACYRSTNDAGVVANSIDVDDGAGYTIDGNPISLGSGGLTASPSPADATSSDGQTPTLTLDAPLNLRAPQTWSITGGPADPQVSVGGTVSDPASDPLTIALTQPVTVSFTDAEVGPLTTTGDGNPNDGAIQIGTLGADAALVSGSLNATDAEPLSFTDGAGLFALGGTIGPTSMASGIVQIGEAERAATLHVAGSLSLDAQSELLAYVNGPGTLAGADYSQLDATGTVDVAGATLVLGSGEGADNLCPQLEVGDVDTLVTAAAVTGQFANAPAGATVSVDCFGVGGTDPTATIGYPGNAVTATVTSAGSPAAATTTTLSTDPANPVVNQPVTITATITPASAVASGGVEFFDDTGSIAGCEDEPVSVSPGGETATCSTAFAPARPADLSATFFAGGGSTVAGSGSATLGLDVGRAPTTTSVTVAPATVGLGQTTVYTATVTTPYPGAAIPSGSLSFLVDGQPLGQTAAGSPSCTGLALDGGASSSSATCQEVFTTGTGDETSAVTAAYAGDGNFMPSTSSPQSVTVDGAAPPPSAGARGTIGRARFGAADVTATMADVVVSCAGSAGQRCSVTLRLSSRERTRGGKLVSASAAALAAKERTVTVGSRTISLRAGLGETVHVELDRSGRLALARLRTLPTTLRATQATSHGSSQPTLRRLTFRTRATKG
jgi:Big-like domain-containing protein